MQIRNSAKAIIIRGDKVLLTKNVDEEGDFYLFPGGGQEHSETLQQALMRECFEEAGYQVEVGELLYIREYIGKNHERSTYHRDFHQVEFYFACTVVNEMDRNLPTNPDSHQVGIEWVKIEDILQYRCYPKELGRH